ncbi:MAG: HEAT repeat domain-containing protein, partial [Planctomycetota bacterium]
MKIIVFDIGGKLECAARALARIGDPSAARLIRSAFSSEDWHFRNYASGVLAAIKSEASEDALLALLRTERDSGIRVWLCLGLCQQFSLRGLPVVLQEIERGYDQSAASLEEKVLPV